MMPHSPANFICLIFYDNTRPYSQAKMLVKFFKTKQIIETKFKNKGQRTSHQINQKKGTRKKKKKTKETIKTNPNKK